MTIVEFFDTNSIENIVSALLCRPDNVIFVGDNHKRINKFITLYSEIIKARGLNINFTAKIVNKNKLENIVQVISSIVEENEDCIFDLEGGEELYLVAVGYIAERYKSRVKLHRFNIKNNSLIDCDADGIVLNTLPAEISVEENIAIYAGKLIKDENYIEWVFENEFIDDVFLMWNICKDNPKDWNYLCSLISVTGEHAIDDNSPLVFELSKNTEFLSWEEKAKCFNKNILRKLYNLGIINEYTNNENGLKFKFKNEQVKNCIKKAGQVLELYITVLAKNCIDKKGKPVYNDIQSNIIVDWDGFDDSPLEKVITSNEIDVIMMKGLVPVFVSCKNGTVEVDELYKLSAVAERFGGKYAKKVLVVSDLDRSNINFRHIQARADEMNIRLIDDVVDLTEKEVEKSIASLWCN